MSVGEFIDLISKGGVVTFLIIATWGFYTEKWVAGVTLQRVIKERDAFRDELLTTLRLADRATRISERTVESIVGGSSNDTPRSSAEHRLRSRREFNRDEE